MRQASATAYFNNPAVLLNHSACYAGGRRCGVLRAETLGFPLSAFLWFISLCAQRNEHKKNKSFIKLNSGKYFSVNKKAGGNS
jgi:hypothetical protein